MSTDDEPPESLRRLGLDAVDWLSCLRLIKKEYPGYAIHEAPDQGGCSYTLKLKAHEDGDSKPGQPETLTVQLRPSRHALCLTVAATAKQWYGVLAPATVEIGRLRGSSGRDLFVYRLEYMAGFRLDRLQHHTRPATRDPQRRLAKYHNLLGDLASFYAAAWTTAREFERESGSQAACNGKVGASVLPRLQRLERELPSASLRSVSRAARLAVEAGALHRLPIVFTHGDLLPSNMLVDELTWRINGLVDWAESEFLPFGISLYCLEHLLGRLRFTASNYRFEYLADAQILRQHFWQQLAVRIPELEQRAVRDAVELARVVGILLWHGFAWDEGRIDRVINPGRDVEELAYLETFLSCERRTACSRL